VPLVLGGALILLAAVLSAFGPAAH